MSDIKAVRYEQEIPDVLDALADVHTKMDGHGLDRKIHHSSSFVPRRSTVAASA